ncbi:histone H3 centromeric protein HTR12 [Spatholobus suberectus]|nr:histone H3 centromeric protein HTR12 [Spatholobus suberectus]
MMGRPKISNTEKAHKEKKIVVDTRSLKESCDVSTTLAATDLHRPSLHPPKPKFLSLSLPNSATSSPSTLMNKKLKHRSIESPCQASTLKHQYDQLQEMHLRSKSCGEGRACAPSDEFDIWWVKPSAVEHENMHHGSLSKIEAIRESLVSGKDVKTYDDEGFKCSVLCLYLPGFGKAKAVKAKKEGSEMEGAVISSTVSLEKFECGSWASSLLFHEIEGDPMNSYFDLPMELIKCSANDVHTPVTSAFVFEKDLKGVVKTDSARKSPHHVRFSTPSSTSKPGSQASCITPRLRKAKEDFTAFLEAQVHEDDGITPMESGVKKCSHYL